jgi:ankyrin repeat protein
MAAAGVNEERFRAAGPRQRASASQVIEAVRLMLDNGGDVNAVNAEGQTALHGAAGGRSSDLVEFLLDHGAKVDIKDKDGLTPLDVAEQQQAKNIVEILSKAASTTSVGR